MDMVSALGRANPWDCSAFSSLFSLLDKGPAGAKERARADPGSRARDKTNRMTITVNFDGGADPNPGAGYGSWRISVNGQLWQQRNRVQFGENVTNNEAEYLALLDALKVVAHFGDRIRLEVLSDSQLVVNQSSGKWKAKCKRMAALRDRVWGFTRRVAGASFKWVPRERNVELFGH